GWLAWWIWGSAHIFFLIGMRNRALVALQWLWSYLTFQRGARLITGDDD
ncbi:MAG: NAD(P)/FAD-dependent oxidoreductase, partial [Gammaproteobacteria bacterium]